MRGSIFDGHMMLAAVFLATSVTARHSNSLFEREATCPDTYNPCSGSSLPSNFCCPSTNTCVVLAGNTTVLCCPPNPNGSIGNCNQIKPITCDITAQNLTLHPGNSLMTTALTVPMSTCAGECCPFGYSCNSAGNCAINSDQKAVPGPGPSSSSASTATSSAMTTTSSRLTTTATSRSSTTASNSPSTGTPIFITKECDKFPATAVLAGFFPGLTAGILLTVAAVCILGARRRKAERRRSVSSFGNISEPRPIDGDMRSDFLRKQPQTPSTIVGSTPERRHTVSRVKSMFKKTPSSPNKQSSRFEPPMPLNVQKPITQNSRPITPPLQREPSYENINIFTDKTTASSLKNGQPGNGKWKANGGLQAPAVNMRESHQTTFSDMMQSTGLAGLQKGQPYVYKGNSPGYTSPPR